MNPSTINILALPSVSLEQRSQLPTTPCVYLAINGEGKVQYVGKSNNPRKRWESHHKGIDLALIGGIRIAYIESDADLLPEIERALIAYFHPPLNRLCREPSVKGVMTVAMRMSEETREQLEAIALQYGCTYGGKPWIAGLLARIGSGELMIVPYEEC